MAKAFLAILCAGLLAMPVFAQTSYEQFRYHPYAQYRYYTPHPYLRNDFDHLKYYPYHYNWAAHRWYGPYYYRKYDQYQYNYNQSHHYYEQPMPDQSQNTNSYSIEETPHPGKRSESSALYYEHPIPNRYPSYPYRW
jgi:hypothetical protein